MKVAIIGRPNVGKSTLFNRLTGKKLALVDPTPGLTRDRKEAKANIGPLKFTIIDTAGLEKAENESLEELMMLQTDLAIEDADILLMMIDGREGVTSTDQHFAGVVRKKDKPTLLLVNKCEGKKASAGISEAYQMGFGEPVAISAEHGEGLADLYDSLTKIVKELGIDTENNNDDGEDRHEILQIAIVGRPNVGKSTLFNKILRNDRSIISDVAGTTRDSVYVDWEFEGKNIKLVDTAGMRKRSKINGKIEKISVNDCLKAIQYANVAVLVLDATQALDKQDLTIADHIINEGRGMIIVVNKWDLVEDKKEVMDEIENKLQYSLHQARGVPIITASALEGINTKKVIRVALELFEVWNMRVSTGKLNRWLKRATENHSPPLSGNKRIKLRYATQAKSRPPTFILFTSSRTKDLPESYTRYLVNSIRDEFGFNGVPIRMSYRKTSNPYSKKN